MVVQQITPITDELAVKDSRTLWCNLNTAAPMIGIHTTGWPASGEGYRNWNEHDDSKIHNCMFY